MTDQITQITRTDQQILEEDRAFSEELRITAEGYRWQGEIRRQQAEELRCTAELERSANYQASVAVELRHTISEARLATEMLKQAMADLRGCSP